VASAGASPGSAPRMGARITGPVRIDRKTELVARLFVLFLE
jgi:hypothetical protein